MTDAIEPEGLSAREKEVAGLLVRGVSNKEIARALGIEVVTVKKHVGNILRTLAVRNRTQAAISLMRRAEEKTVVSSRTRDEFTEAG